MLLLASLAVIVIGFFFPPLWLILVGGLIYLVASHKSRRADAVESRIKRMVAEGKTEALSSKLYFEAARSYAVSKGAKAAEKNAASTHVMVDGVAYFVVFTRATSGGTIITVRRLEDVRNEMFAHIRPRRPQSKKPGPAARETFDSGSQSAGFELGGVMFHGDPDSNKIMAEIIHKIADEVDRRLKVDEQTYQYVMEEAEWIAGRNAFCKELLDETGLLEVEYQGARDRARNRSDKCVAAAYVENDVWPALRLRVGDTKAECIRAVIFGSILERNRIGVDAMRGQYAAAFVRNLKTGGASDAAKDWTKVVELVTRRSSLAS